MGLSRLDLARDLAADLALQDDLEVRAAAVGVAALAAPLLAGPERAREIGALARDLARALATRGLEGALDAPTGWRSPQGTADPLADALAVRACGEGSALDSLASAIETAGEWPWHHYAAEVLVTALLDAGSAAASLADLDALDARRDAVIAAPNLLAPVGAYHVVRDGEDLGDLAEAILGDRKAWPDLIALYGLQPPYFSAEPRTGCLMPGARLMLPPTAAEVRSDEADLGATLALEADGDTWDVALGADGDLIALGGLEGFAADLALRAATPLGDLPEERAYGMPGVQGLDASVGGVVQAMLLIDTLREDPRVGSVSARPGAATSARRGVLAGDVLVTPRPDLVRP